MDYDGLMIKYKYRASPVLTEDERANQLYQNEKIDLGDKKIMDDAAVIHLSSGYIEVVDKWYAIKGFLTVPSLALLVLFAAGVIYIPYNMFVHFFCSRIMTDGFIPSVLLLFLCQFWSFYSVI